jgi:hypothetical protein
MREDSIRDPKFGCHCEDDLQASRWITNKL